MRPPPPPPPSTAHLCKGQQLGHAPDHLLHKHGVGVAQCQTCRGGSRWVVLVKLAARWVCWLLPSCLLPLPRIIPGPAPLLPFRLLPLEGLQAINEDVEQAEPAVSSCWFGLFHNRSSGAAASLVIISSIRCGGRRFAVFQRR